MSQNKILTEEEIFEYSSAQLILLALGERNPGAHSVVSKLFEFVEKDESKNIIVMNIIENLMTKNIVGARLWYIYKNEAQMNIEQFINLNLEQFTDDYFYEKFEKYTKNL